MNNVTTAMVFVPGIVALLGISRLPYLYEQSRQGYFRAWQLAWAAYTLHYALEGDLATTGEPPLSCFF